MDYKKLVSIKCVLKASNSVPAVIDSKGMLCKLYVTQGRLFITTEDTIDSANDEILVPGDEIEFIGKVTVCSTVTHETNYRILLYEKT